MFVETLFEVPDFTVKVSALLQKCLFGFGGSKRPTTLCSHGCELLLRQRASDLSQAPQMQQADFESKLILRQACRRINLAFKICVCKLSVLHCRRSIINSAMLLHTSSTQSEQYWNGCATCSAHRRQMSFRARTFADFQHPFNPVGMQP